MRKIGLILLSIVIPVLIGRAQEVNSDIIRIIQYGSYAPSSHNAQMWKVKILNENKISVSVNSDRALPYVDAENREAWISIGAFTENCVQAAQDFGYTSQVQTGVDEVIITFLPDPEWIKSTRNRQVIEKRLTIRTPYLDVDLAPSAIDSITCLSGDVHYYAKNTPEGNQIIRYSIEANQVQMNDTSKLHELARWMTFSYKEEKQRKDGMTPEALGITGINHFLFNTFMNRQSVTGKMFINGSVQKATTQLHACSGFALITSHGSEVKDLVESGRILERLWLFCTQNKIALHPMSQVLEEQPCYDALKTTLHIDEDIQMLLRLGKVKTYPERTGRRVAVDQFVIK